jgi:hypothetical protein
LRVSIVNQLQKLYNRVSIERKDEIMGYGRKSQAVKMLRRKGQAKKKAKIKAKIVAGKAAKAAKKK